SSHSFIFNTTTTTAIYTLSLHDALPISREHNRENGARVQVRAGEQAQFRQDGGGHFLGFVDQEHGTVDGSLDVSEPFLAEHIGRSEEHTSELQSPYDLVCRLLLEKKKKK